MKIISRRLHKLPPVLACLFFMRLAACAEPQVAGDPAVVSIFLFDAQNRPTGDATGFFVSADGKFASTRHAIKNAARAVIQMNDGKELPVAGIIAEDPLHDLVLLKIDGGDFPYLKLGDFHDVRKDAAVRMMITPYKLRQAAVSKQWAVGSGGRTVPGNVARVENMGGDSEWFSVKMPTIGGESGSPVLDGDGRVLGMIWGGTLDHSGGSVVSVDYIKALIAKAGVAAPQPLTALKKRRFDDVYADTDFLAAVDAAWHDNYNEAIRRMELAAKDFPESGGYQMQLGSYYSRVSRWKEADAAFRKACAIKPDNALALASLAMTCTYEGKAEEAMELCGKAAALDPHDAKTLFNIAGAYIALKHPDEARAAIQKLRDLSTPEATAYAGKLTAAVDLAARKQEKP